MPEDRAFLRGYGELRKGRWSERGRDYFLTICVQRPSIGLLSEEVASAVSGEQQRLEQDGHWHVRTSVIMPDHLHLLVTLGDATPLSGVVRLLKGRVAPVLRAARLRWQQSFYDHCLRSGDDLLPVFLYVFLNPYRANLVHADTDAWAHYYCAPDDWAWFSHLTRERLPFPEWLQ